MAVDATGTPTSLGIPKYNTNADAPSGKGFNAAMDSIDALLLARVNKPASIATGEAPVWNGSTFARSSVTNIGPSSLGSGTPDSTKYLRGDGSWQLPGLALLDDQTLGSNVGQVDFLNIPGAYRNLRIVWEAGTSDAADQSFFLRFNNDSGANYSQESVSGAGATAASSGATGQAQAQLGVLAASGQNSGGEITIISYTGVRNKTFVSTFHAFGGTSYAGIAGGKWASVAAVTRITLLPTSPKLINAGGRFMLYGMA